MRTSPTKYNITREEQDEFAVESHRRALAAMKNCRFQEQIVPVELKSKEGVTQFRTDEHPRADASLEGMAKLRPAFSKTGTVTAGNSSGLNDAAGAVVVMNRETAEKRGLEADGEIGCLFAGRRGTEVHGNRSGARRFARF